MLTNLSITQILFLILDCCTQWRCGVMRISKVLQSLVVIQLHGIERSFVLHQFPPHNVDRPKERQICQISLIKTLL